MSWFTDIAGKAEDLLNRVDQTAATALQNKSKTPSYKSEDQYVKSSRSDATYGSTFSAGSAFSSPQRTKSSKFNRSSENKNLYSPNLPTPRKKPESDDEKLLRYLNSSEAVLSEQHKSEKQSKSANLSKEHVHPIAEVNTSLTESDIGESFSVAENSTDANSGAMEQPSTIIDGLPEELPEITTSTLSADDTDNNENSEADNSVIQTDLMVVEKRALHAEAEMKRMMKKLDHWNSQISSNDKLVRELREREKDMTAAMDAKDSQLAILKVRLQEADQELLVKQNVIEELTAENEKIVKDHAEGASFQNKTVEVLRDQLQQIEAELNKTKESLHQSQTDHMNQRTNMEEEHRHLVESYTSLQKKWNDLSERNRELLSQLKSANANFETLQHEYNDYKIKAQRILQTKEKLISNLKDGNCEGDSTEKADSSSALLNVEVDSIKQERDLLKEELRRSNELIENFRYEVQELEKTSQNDLATSQERCRILKEQLDMEKVQREEFQLLNSQLKEEMDMLRDDLATTKNSFQSRIQDREIEIEKLRRQLTAKSLSTVSQDELESRLHALTENLIQKQTVVEALSTEKNSLVLQLERLEQQLREAQNYGAQQHTYVGINNNDTERKSKSMFLDNPFDSAMTRKVKRVYGTIDALSIRLGVFFRRFPIARVFVIIYMILLHFWVLTVLLTYEPEVHNSGYEHVKQ